VDVLPTLIEAVGDDPATGDIGRPGAPDGGRGFDGTSFLRVLTGQTQQHRDTVFGIQTQPGTINGLPYPVRAVCDGRYKLIVNLAHASEYRNALTGSPDPRHENAYWQEWLAAVRTDPRASFLVERYRHRPPVELYDLENNPWEMDNRASNTRLAAVRDVLERRLDAWMRQQGDTGLEIERKARDRQ
jgi:N-sulfoglucosamine sulfohydrolase